jgi:hypothetical protein
MASVAAAAWRKIAGVSVAIINGVAKWRISGKLIENGIEKKSWQWHENMAMASAAWRRHGKRNISKIESVKRRKCGASSGGMAKSSMASKNIESNNGGEKAA